MNDSDDAVPDTLAVHVDHSREQKSFVLISKTYIASG